MGEIEPLLQDYHYSWPQIYFGQGSPDHFFPHVPWQSKWSNALIGTWATDGLWSFVAMFGVRSAGFLSSCRFNVWLVLKEQFGSILVTRDKVSCSDQDLPYVGPWPTSRHGRLVWAVKKSLSVWGMPDSLIQHVQALSKCNWAEWFSLSFCTRCQECQSDQQSDQQKKS